MTSISLSLCLSLLCISHLSYPVQEIANVVKCTLFSLPEGALFPVKEEWLECSAGLWNLHGFEGHEVNLGQSQWIFIINCLAWNLNVQDV